MQLPKDPHLDRLIQQQLQNGSPQQQLAAAQVWAVCGHCPICGAPIWFCAAAPAQSQPPQATYTCPCAMLASERARIALDALKVTDGPHRHFRQEIGPDEPDPVPE